MAEQEEQKFEESLTELEGIVKGMERGELSLEESMVKFEKGMKLSRFCSRKLGEAEKRVEILLKEADSAQWAELPDAEEGGRDVEDHAGRS